jgi:hypothetical protein
VYYLRKTLRRHRSAAWSTCAVVLLVAGLTAYGSVHIARARSAQAAATELARHEGLGHHYLRLDRLADARREFAAALSVAATDADRDRVRSSLSQADGRLHQCFHGVPFHVGQIIRAEHFDTGGEGVSYHDTDATNDERNVRGDTRVDFINGYLACVRAGEWVQYTIDVPEAGLYDFECRGGNTYGPAGVLRVEFEGVDKTGSVQVPGPVKDYVVFRRTGLRLNAGTQVMRVFFEAEAPQGYVGAIDWFRVLRSGEGKGDGDSGETRRAAHAR